jgi:hypothetical protein
MQSLLVLSLGKKKNQKKKTWVEYTQELTVQDFCIYQLWQLVLGPELCVLQFVFT